MIFQKSSESSRKSKLNDFSSHNQSLITLINHEWLKNPRISHESVKNQRLVTNQSKLSQKS